MINKILDVEVSLDKRFDKVDDKFDKVYDKIDKVVVSLGQDTKNITKRIDRFMFWSLGVTLTSTFLILTLIYKMLPVK